MSTQKEKALAAVAIVQALAEAIREPRTVPSGQLYARVMGNLTLEQYNEVISLLTRTGLVTLDKENVLHWNLEPLAV